MKGRARGAIAISIASLAALVGCAQIFGIEEREEVTSQGDGGLDATLADAGVDATLADAGADARDATQTTDAKPDANAPPAVFCGDMSGLQQDAAWPMLGYCPSHIGLSPYAGPDGKDGGVAIARVMSTGGMPAQYPAIDKDGVVYVGSDDQNLYAFAPDGSPRWSPALALGGTIQDSTPAIATDGSLYVSSGHMLIKIDPAPPGGMTKWMFDTTTHAQHPLIGGDGTIYVAATDRVIAVTDQGAMGVEKWTVDGGAGGTSLAMGGFPGRVYFGIDNTLHAVEADGGDAWRLTAIDASSGTLSEITIGGAAGTTLYFGTTDGIVHEIIDMGSAPSAGVDHDLGFAIGGDPALGPAGDRLYVGAGSNVVAIIPGTNGMQWSVDVGGNIATPIAVDARGTVYATTANGFVTAIDDSARDTTPMVRWRIQLPAACNSGVVIGADHLAYVSDDDGNVYALGP